MKKNKKKFAIITTILFLVILATPLLFINKERSKISVVENKNLASLPQLYDSNGKINKSFIGEFEMYISDNIGFKQEIVIADIAIQYRLFNIIKVPSFIMGKN